MKNGKITFAKFFSRGMNIITALALAVALCFSVGAWYSKNMRTSASPVLLDLEADDAVASYNVYKYDLVNNCGISKDGEGNPLTISNIDFNQYDLIFKSRNRYTPVLAHIIVTKIESTPLEGKLKITISRDATIADAELTAGNPLPKYSSSILRVTAQVDKEGELTDKLYETTSADFDLYMYVDGLMYTETLEYTGTHSHNEGDAKTGGGTYDNATGTFFSAIGDPYEVTLNEGTANEREVTRYDYTREDEVSFTVNYTEDDWDDAWTSGEEVIHVYLYMTYDTTLMNCVAEEQDMTEISIGKNVIDFANDLQLFRIECIEEEGNS